MARVGYKTSVKAFDLFYSFRRMILGKYFFNLKLIHSNDNQKTIVNKVIKKDTIKYGQCNEVFIICFPF